jgi:carboxylesterase
MSEAGGIPGAGAGSGAGGGHSRTRGGRPLRVGALLAGAAVVLYLALCTPWNVSRLASHPHPTHDYAGALERIRAFEAREPAPMNPVGRLKLLTQGHKVARAIVLVHGYTNCPEQFRTLGERFHALGYNVLIAPLPHHGLADRMTKAHGRLTADELARYTDETVDIAQGLGEHVTVMGLSAGGVVAGWVAANRKDVDCAVLIAPAFEYGHVATPLTVAAMNALIPLPDEFDWWNPKLKEKVPPEYCYPWHSRRALMQILRLGFATRDKARTGPPRAQRIVVVTTASDHGVNNAATMGVVGLWRAHGATVTTYEFPESLHVQHDMIDPQQPDQRIEIVYPKLIELVEQAQRHAGST